MLLLLMYPSFGLRFPAIGQTYIERIPFVPPSTNRPRIAERGIQVHRPHDVEVPR